MRASAWVRGRTFATQVSARGREDDSSWVRRFGEPLLSSLEPTAVGGPVERRVLYESGPEVPPSLGGQEATAW